MMVDPKYLFATVTMVHQIGPMEMLIYATNQVKFDQEPNIENVK